MRDEDDGSSLQQCANTYLPPLDGARGTFDRGSNDSIIMPCPDLVTTEAIECPSTNIIISIQTSTVTTTVLKTVSPNTLSSDQKMSRTLVQNMPAGSTGSANGVANCLQSSASQFTHAQPVYSCPASYMGGGHCHWYDYWSSGNDNITISSSGCCPH